MADRSGLKFVGFIFATVTLAVMLTTGMVVKGYADGGYSLESTAIASRVVRNSLTIARAEFGVNSAGPSAAPDQRQHHDDDQQQSDKPDHDGAHAVRRTPQRNRIGVVRPNAFHQDISPKYPAA